MNVDEGSALLKYIDTITVGDRTLRQVRESHPDPLWTPRKTVYFTVWDYGFACEVDRSHSTVYARDRKRLSNHGALYTICTKCIDVWLENNRRWEAQEKEICRLAFVSGLRRLR